MSAHKYVYNVFNFKPEEKKKNVCDALRFIQSLMSASTGVDKVMETCQYHILKLFNPLLKMSVTFMLLKH